MVRRYRAARRDRDLVVVQGFHALKHALRFGAELVEVIAADPDELERLASDLAPDLSGSFGERAAPVSEETIAAIVPQGLYTRVVALARRPRMDLGAILGDPRPAPVVLLEEPRNMGNMGACVRVAAAGEAAGVLTVGSNDPWSPEAVQAAAGLHFALPVAGVATLLDIVRQRRHSNRPLVAIDPKGEGLRPAELPPRSILAFGTERHGLSPELLEHADLRLGIPMRAGVSSLNLATTVSAVLFAQRLG